MSSGAAPSAPLDLLIQNAACVVTCAGPHPGPGEAALDRQPDAVVGVTGAHLSFVGNAAALPSGAVTDRTVRLDARGGFVGPGFVDAHTHLVFAGERAHEFAQRCAGQSYAEIAAAGGGIASTVRAVRAASDAQLLEGARARLRRLLAFGVTTAEVKSGYGLNLADELRLLRVVQQLGKLQPVTLVPTLLCAHALPPELQHDRAAYLRLCREEILPAVVRERLARFCDVFVERGAFRLEEARELLLAAAAAGLGLRVHAEQLSASGGAALAADLGAVSADHLEHLAPEDIPALARAGVAATLLPTSTLFLQLPRYAPGRALWDAGVTVALGTNVNPGSAMSENHALTLGLACLQNGLTPAEAYWAATRGGALALREGTRGRLVPGAPADVVCFDVPGPEQLPYHLGMNRVRWVLKDGRLVSGDGAAAR